uniref:Uncharacterized protein n=1 Tax=Spongospora subterranea TaxID=70186 RepID=A0A0H5QY29_9EUKA|eukprot:CRZ00489.1 hypothetical protein [Spongospora subterranea]
MNNHNCGSNINNFNVTTFESLYRSTSLLDQANTNVDNHSAFFSSYFLQQMADIACRLRDARLVSAVKARLCQTISSSTRIQMLSRILPTQLSALPHLHNQYQPHLL